MERTNLHEALNIAHSHCRDYPAARDLVSSGMPELIQVRDEENGKTYLYCLCYGEGSLETDICVIDYTTGKMSIIPREDADPEAAYFDGYRPQVRK